MPTEDVLKAGESRALSNEEPSFYRGSGRPNPQAQGKAKGRRGRKAAVSLILTLLLGGGAIFTMTGNTAVVGQIASNVIGQAGDNNYSANTNRTLYLISHFLKNDSNEASLYRNIPDSLKKSFSANGIEIEGSAGNQVFHWNGETYQGDQLRSLYKNDPKFRKAYSDSAKVRSSGFFSKNTNKLMQKWGVSRNNLKDFKSTGDAEADAQKYREIQEPHFDTNDSSAGVTRKNSEENIEVEHEDGSKTTKKDYSLPDDDIAKSSKVDSTSSQVSDGAKASAHNYINTASRAVADASNIGCIGYRVANMISMVTSSLATYSSIKYALSVMESFSKVQTGEGDSSAINETLNNLFETRTVTVTDYSKIDTLNNGENAGQVELTGAAVQEPGFASIISGAAIGSAAGKYFSNANINNSALKAFGTNQNTLSACAVGTAFQATASLVSVAVSGGVAKVVATFFQDALLSVLINTTISATLSFAIPTIARLLFTNTFDTSVGMIAGANIAMGLGATSSKLAQSTGAAFANRDLNNQYQQETSATLALDAEVDRLNRSPFDVSSQNTFLGSIAHSLLPLRISGKFHPISTVSTLTKVTSSSLAQLTSSTYAAGTANTFQTYYGDCPNADSSGMSGNMYCTTHVAHDPSTNNVSPEELMNVLTQNGLTIDANGKHEIKPNSDLARYISFVVNRESEPGVLDANILGAIENSKLPTGEATDILGNLPIVGDIIDVATAFVDLQDDTVAWATGAVNSNDPEINHEWDTKYKYFAQYVSDMNILTNLGVTSANNAIANYTAEYEKEHPVDNSRAGYIARISGITKHDAETVLAIVDYYHDLENYDIGSVIAAEAEAAHTLKSSATLIAEATEPTSPIKSSSPSRVTLFLAALFPNQPVYNDLRNRNYLA